MEESHNKWNYWGVVAILLFLVGSPYILATYATGPDHVFGGFLLNPIDGNSYLAKMRLGLEGSWQFTLPYTSEPGEGSYLFVFYLFLGHLARTLNWSLLFTFHFARLAGAAFLTLSLYQFCKYVFASERFRWMAFTFALFGSGLGWLAFVTTGVITSDFWVAEAYPFLSAYANPHFAFGLAIQLWLLTPGKSREIRWRYGIKLAVAAMLLAEIAPFAVPVVVAIYGGLIGWRLVAKENFKADVLRLFWIGLGSAPILVYDLWIINTHPALSGWNAQNLTPSPPVWDLLISTAPASILAILAVRLYVKSAEQPQRLLIVWLVVCFVLLYVPFNLQRRFLTGYFVPVAFLAFHTIERIASNHPRRYRRLVVSLFAVSIPTNMIVLLIAVFGVLGLEPQIVLIKHESLAFEWIDENLSNESLMLAAPDTGLYLPAYSSIRVVYGHPFETLGAEEQEASVISFYSEWNQDMFSSFLIGSDVDYVFLGPRERSLGNLPIPANWQIVYENPGVVIYVVDTE